MMEGRFLETAERPNQIKMQQPRGSSAKRSLPFKGAVRAQSGAADSVNSSINLLQDCSTAARGCHSLLFPITVLELLLLLNRNRSASYGTEASVYSTSACRKVEV